MKTIEVMEEVWTEGIAFREGKTLEELLRRYEVLVHTLALHLTNDESAADRITIEVFLRLSQEHHKYPHEAIDNLVHRFTYDAALPELLEQMEKLTDEVDIFDNQMAGAENRLIC